LGCGLAEGNSCSDSNSDGGCGRGWGGGCRCGGGRGNGQWQKLNNQLSKSKKMSVKTTAEVVWRPSAEEGNMAMVAVAVMGTAVGGRVAGRWGCGGDRSDSCHGVQPSFSKVIDDHHSTGKSWGNTSRNNDGGGGGRGGGGGGGGGSGRGGGGGEKNRHTPSPHRRRTAILPD